MRKILVKNRQSEGWLLTEYEPAKTTETFKLEKIGEPKCRFIMITYWENKGKYEIRGTNGRAKVQSSATWFLDSIKNAKQDYNLLWGKQ